MNDRFEFRKGDAVARIANLFAAQQHAFAAEPYPSVAQRKAHLRALKKQLLRYQDLLADAISADFGFRAPAESKMLDVLGSTLEINHAISHLRRWMRPSRRATELLFLTNSLRVTYQPKGVVGVIVPWNFPLYLAIGPLAAALAAGNRVMIKMPEVTPATNAVLRRLLGEAFAEDRVAVVGEELEDPNAFTSLAFDHIVFGVRGDMRLMREEIFGPILPVVCYDTLDEAIAHINRGPRPLALYLFSRDAAEREQVLRRTHSGGVTINDWGWHVINHDAPFGGVGNSGMGTYHGIEGFRELSHAKAVFKRHRFFPIGLFYPPYGNFVQRLVLKIFLGEGDPTLGRGA